jgi:Glyoxalase/Bleomycin resistance protein/Dioxygenase superfamily
LQEGRRAYALWWRVKPTEHNRLVFYLPDEAEWQQAAQRLESRGDKPVKAFNLYWDNQGKTFEDPDGYRVVLQNARCSP